MSLLSFGSQLGRELSAGVDKMEQQKKADAAAALQAQRQATQDAQQATNFANQQTTFNQQQERLPVEQARADEAAELTLKSARYKSADEDRVVQAKSNLSRLYSLGLNSDSKKITPEQKQAFIEISNGYKDMTDAGYKMSESPKGDDYVLITMPNGQTIEKRYTPQDILKATVARMDSKDAYDTDVKTKAAAAKYETEQQGRLDVARVGAGGRLQVANVQAGASNYRADRGVEGRRISAYSFGSRKPVEGDVFGNPVGGSSSNQQKSAQFDPKDTVILGYGDKKKEVNVGAIIEAYPTMPQSSKDLVDEKFMDVYGTDVKGLSSGGAQKSTPSLTPPVKPYVINKAADSGFKAQISSLSGANKEDATKAYGSLMMSIGGLSSADPSMKQQSIEATKNSAVALAKASLSKGKLEPDPVALVKKTVDIISNATGQSKEQVAKIFFNNKSGPAATAKTPAKLTAAEALKQRKVVMVKNPVEMQPLTAEQQAANNLNKF